MLSGKKSSFKDALPWTGIVRNASGLTILELIIAFVVLQVAIVAFVQFMMTALDYSREVRGRQMAQILAQAKMEELLRTIPADTTLALSPEETVTPQLLNTKPGDFREFASAHSEDVDAFRWVAEVNRSAGNPNLLNVTLHVYAIKTRMRTEKSAEPVEDFYLPDGLQWFTYARSLSDGSVEMMRGKEKVQIVSAVAAPQP